MVSYPPGMENDMIRIEEEVVDGDLEANNRNTNGDQGITLTNEIIDYSTL